MCNYLCAKNKKKKSNWINQYVIFFKKYIASVARNSNNFLYSFSLYFSVNNSLHVHQKKKMKIFSQKLEYFLIKIISPINYDKFH